MVDYAVRVRGTADEIHEWAGIKQALDSNTNVRNFSAHYNLSLSFDDDLNPLAASLVRPPFAQFGKDGHTVEKQAIEEAGVALEKAAFKIGELAVMIADRLYPEEMARHNAGSAED